MHPKMKIQSLFTHADGKSFEVLWSAKHFLGLRSKTASQHLFLKKKFPTSIFDLRSPEITDRFDKTLFTHPFKSHCAATSGV